MPQVIYNGNGNTGGSVPVDNTNYTANGLLPVTLDYSTNFGHNPPQTCAWIMKATSTGFTAVSSTPYCGKDLPHTSTASSS